MEQNNDVLLYFVMAGAVGVAIGLISAEVKKLIEELKRRTKRPPDKGGRR